MTFKLFASLAGLLTLSSSYFLLHGDVADNSPEPTSYEVSVPEVVDQPRRLNSWFSSAYSFPTQYLHALPGMYKIDEEGISFNLHAPHASPKAIVTAIGDDCRLSLGDQLTDAKVLEYGDWHVRLGMYAGTQYVGTLTLTQGMPVTYLKGPESISVTCQDATFESVDNEVLVKHHGKQYLVEAASGSITITDDAATLSDPAGDYRISLLSNDTDRSVFSNNPWQPVTNTSASWQDIDGDYETRFDFHVDQPLLTTLWPHQVVEGKASIGTYQTSVGQLSLVSTTGFSTTLAKPTLPLAFDPVRDDAARSVIRDQLQQDAQRLLDEVSPSGVYFRGTWLGSLTSAIQLAQSYELDSSITDRLLDRLHDELTDSLDNIAYSQAINSMIATNPEFGQEKGNDHHFHYGYYIRAASVLAESRPEVLDALEPKINKLIGDIASTDRDGDFPRLRHYDVYAGHSWADGQAQFADGNNQESTSEALNAWYGIYRWGTATDDSALQDLGSWLFASELAGTKTYWFGQNNPFPDGYEHTFASIVWSAKRDYATWFSADPMHILGIQLLPITPASIYLAELPLKQLRADVPADPYAHEWGDLYISFESLHGLDVQGNIDQVSSDAGTKLRSLMLHAAYSNN